MIKNFLFTFISIILVLSCENVVPTQDNPLDPGNEDYVEPTIAFASELSDGDIISTETLSIAWEGNQLVTEYRYKLDSFSWTDWFEDASVTLDYLDEGEHTISIQSRYLSGDTSAIASLSFVVDAVGGPALMFYPRRQITTQGSTVTFQVMAEEVSALMAAEIHLEFDPSKIEIVSVTQGTLFQNGQESIFNCDINVGSIEILTSLLNSDIPYVNGTGELASIEIRSLGSGETNLLFEGVNTFRDESNNTIAILEIINGKVFSQ